MALSKEPGRLRRGKRFHKSVQEDWHLNAEGEVETEKGTVRGDGSRGRIDIYVKTDGKLVAVAEVKASDWDRMDAKAVRRNVRRQIRQIWGYIESRLTAGEEVSPGVIFPKRPRNRARMELIEAMFEEEGLPVVWEDETIEERKEQS